MTVHFHVLFSPSMDLNRTDEVASIRFNVDRFGGWKSAKNRIVLKPEKYELIDSIFHLYATVLRTRKPLLIHARQSGLKVHC